MIIIGITGTLGAGKSTIANHLVEKWGFSHHSVRDFIAEEVKKRGLPITRATMAEIGNELRAEYGAAHIVKGLSKRAAASGKNAVIESVRTAGEVEALRKHKNFYLLAVDADPKTRYQRILQRGTETDAVSYEKFLADEKREFQSDDPAVQNLSKCVELANHRFNNNGTTEELQNQVDAVLKTVI